MAGTRTSARLRGAQEAKNLSKPTSKGRVAAPPRRATRQSRPEPAAMEAKLRNSSPEQPRVQSRPHRGNNIARRSAKQAVDSQSVASIRTAQQDGSDYNEDSGEDESEGSDEDPIASQLDNDPRRLGEASAVGQRTLNADMMVKSRQYLYVAAQDMYEHLCLGDSDPTWNDMLRTLRDAFDKWSGHYSTGRTPFLDRKLIDKTLEGRETQGPAVSHIVSAANLVILLDFVHQVTVGDEEPLDLFEQIDEDFPWCIMAPGSAIDASYDEYGTFERALRIRISLWVFRILATENCTPEAAMEIGASLIFGRPGNYTEFPTKEDIWDVDLRSVYGVEFDTLSDDTLSDEDKTRMEDIWREFDRVRQIILSDRGFDPEGLRQASRVDTYLGELSQWAEDLFGEVAKTIANESSRPGTGGQAQAAVQERILKSLHDGIDSMKSLLKASKGSQLQSASNVSSRKRHQGGDTGEGDSYDFITSPVRKKPRSRAPRTRAVEESEPHMAGHEDTEDAPHGTRDAAERPSRPTVPQTPSHTQKQPQKRVFWDKHDERVLRHWVKVHGCYWKHMEAMALGSEPGGELLLVKRTQQQFRDKARNMKVDMLRNDWILSENFDSVVLGRKEKELLMRLGKNPDREEKDVEDGQPVNTEYVPPDE